MIKRIIPGLLATLIVLNLSAQDRSIKFGKNYEKALAKAKSENKLVFMDAYATWCGPCKWMSANMFTKNEVADFYNEKFVNLKVDMEKGDGPELAKKYGVRAYPTLLFLDSEGNMVHKKVGAMGEVQDYITMGNNAMDPNSQFAGKKAKYDSGDFDKTFLREYLVVAGDAGENVEEVLTKYYESVGDKELVNQENWEVIKKYDRSVDSKGMSYLLNNRDQFYAAYDKKEVDEVLYSNHLNHVMRILYAKEFSKRDFDIAIIDVKKKKIPGWEKIALRADLQHLKKQGKKDEYLELMILEVLEVFMHDPMMLNNYAWETFEMSDDPVQLAEALKWSERSLLMQESAATQDTHSNILFKLGKKEEAIASQEKAIELAKAGGEPTEDYEKTLESFKK